MITFDEEFKVLEKENRSVPRRDGNGTFDFTEIKIESLDKKPTVLSARLLNDEMASETGHKYNMRIGITSTLTVSGRVFTNFIVLATMPIDKQPETTVLLDDDDLPFN